MPVPGTPSGGPSASLMRAVSCLTRSGSTSVKRTTRMNIGDLLLVGERTNPISYLARTMPSRVLPLAIGLFAVALAGCGDSGSTSTTPAPSDTATPKPEDFPKGSKLNFSDLQSKYPAQL